MKIQLAQTFDMDTASVSSKNSKSARMNDLEGSQDPVDDDRYKDGLFRQIIKEHKRENALNNCIRIRHNGRKRQQILVQ